MLSSGEALDFALFGSSSHCNVSLATLGTMCHLSLEVWTNTLSVYFICFISCFVLFLSVYMCFCMYIKFFLFDCCYVANWAQLTL
jgi:hypothetical protein